MLDQFYRLAARFGTQVPLEPGVSLVMELRRAGRRIAAATFEAPESFSRESQPADMVRIGIQDHPAWLRATWARKAKPGQSAREAYNDYMREYKRQRRAKRSSDRTR